MRKFLTDTFVMIVFSTAIGMIIEIIVAGLAISQSFNARVMAIPVNLLTGGLQGIFYDYIFKIFKVNKKSKIQKSMAEIVAFTFFQIPINAFILLVAGANLTQVKKSGSILIISCIFISKLYSSFLNFCRKLFKTK